MTIRTIYGRRRIAVLSQRLIAGFHRSRRVGFSVVILGLSVSLAAADPAKRMFNIEAKPATQSLTDYARQAHSQLGYDVDVVDDILTNRVVGEYDSAEALELLLKDTGLEAEHGERGIFVRRLPKREVGSGMEERTPPVAETNSLQFAQTSAAEAQATVDQNQTSRRTETDSGEDEKRQPLEEIIVTGTNIRGIAPESSPTRTFTREDIQISGAATAQDFIQTLPGNFGGGSNVDLAAGVPNDINAGANDGFGSSVNLRGLGSGATLVLLNGHRLAPSSSIGDFTDISMIPASAIERVEILSDGASSIYGSDAVAGVTNFILRDDFEGLETSFRYGIGTQRRSAEEFRVGVTGGLNWDSGHTILSYEYFNQDEIGAQDRSFSQDAFLPTFLQPSQERHSVVGSISEDISANLEVFADAIFSKRKAVQNSTTSFSTIENVATSETLSISAGGTWNPTDTWFLDTSGTYSELDTTQEFTGTSATGSNDADSKVWTADIKTSGSALNLPGGDLKLAFGAHYRREDFQFSSGLSSPMAHRNVYAAFGEAFIPIVGPDNAIPSIKRLELNVSGRFDDYSDFGSTANPKVGALWSPVENLNFRGSYSTSFNPPPLGTVGGANQLVVSARENAFFFPFFGITAADPSIADAIQLFIFGVEKDLNAETSRAFTAGLDFVHQWDRNDISMSITWFDIDFENRLGRVPIPDNRLEIDAPNIAFTDPDAFPEGTIIFDPSLDQINEFLSRAGRLLVNSPPFFGDPFDATIINTVNVTRNLGVTLVSGLDFDLAYTHHTEIGKLSIGVDGTYLLESKKQGAATSPLVSQLNTLYNPVDLRLRGRLGLARDGLTANMFVNYVNGYRADNTADAMVIDSWTTIDLSLSYDTSNEMDNSILDNMVFRLSVINLFDQDPPSAPSNSQFLILGYDPTNSSPLGRFVAFEMTKYCCL